jgi:hypothetical protein
VRSAGKRLVVATPRILKPDEQRLSLFYLRLGADALLLRRWLPTGPAERRSAPCSCIRALPAPATCNLSLLALPPPPPPTPAAARACCTS